MTDTAAEIESRLLEAKALMPDHVMVGGRKHYLTDAEISFAYQLSRQARELEGLNKTILLQQAQNQEMRDERDLYREHLRDALRSLGQPYCTSCEGTGGAEKWKDNTTSRSWEPDERMVGYHDPTDEACDDCCGTGKVLK